MRLVYWTTSCLEPEIEAVSKEVFDLSSHFQGSRVVAVSPHLTFKYDRATRAIGFHPKLDPLLRVWIPRLERSCDVNHVYAETSPWLFYRTLRRRPIVLTIASEKGEPIPEFLGRCKTVVAQTEGMRTRLKRLGLTRTELRLIYPGVDLSRFTPRSEIETSGRPRILMATFPRSASEMSARGVSFLLQAAKAYPEMDFTFVSRPWRTGESALAETKRLIAEYGLRNVTILEGLQQNMEGVYKEHHFTIVPYTSADGGKECPRSLIESLACGVPVLISAVASMAALVDRSGCGTVYAAGLEPFAQAVEHGLSQYRHLSENAAHFARGSFDLASTRREYAGIYSALG